VAAASRDADLLLLSRDHGGPYQHPYDLFDNADADVAIGRALGSLKCDIESGVEILHIDTSVGIHGAPETFDVASERAIALVGSCVDMAHQMKREIAFEIGYEVQTEYFAELAEFSTQLHHLIHGLRRWGVVPAFVVCQTGTKVNGRKNVGLITSQARREAAERVHALSAVAGAYGAHLKAHNCDYLDSAAIQTLTNAGAWLNISPELGLAQTITIVKAARRLGITGTCDAFCNSAVNAGFWRKWVSDPTEVSDEDKVALGGSYLFSTPSFAALRDELDYALAGYGGSTMRLAIDAIKTVVTRYTR
jgi:hypothetical protein